MIERWGICCEIALIWMSLDFTDDQSRLVQVMAWCCQATSHYLSQCWPRSLSPSGVTRPQPLSCWIVLRKHENTIAFDIIMQCHNLVLWILILSQQWNVAGCWTSIIRRKKKYPHCIKSVLWLLVAWCHRARASAAMVLLTCLTWIFQFSVVQEACEIFVIFLNY